jgi:hypothetical protein
MTTDWNAERRMVLIRAVRREFRTLRASVRHAEAIWAEAVRRSLAGQLV